MSTARTISGNDALNERKDEIVSDLVSGRYTDIRINQQQVDADGRLVGINRPDIQATSPEGVRRYYELDTESSGQGLRHLARILSNDDDGDVELMEQED